MGKRAGYYKEYQSKPLLHLPKRVDSRGYVKLGGYREHRYVAEQALGRKLAKGEEVHHVDEDKTNNVGSNLVVCSSAYHRLIHARMSALAACGDPNANKCTYCKEYGTDLTRHGYHKGCHAAYNKARYHAKKRAAQC